MIPERLFQLGAICDSMQYWPQGWLPVAASRGKQLSKTHFTFYRAGCRAALVSLRYSQQHRQTLPPFPPTLQRPDSFAARLPPTQRHGGAGTESRPFIPCRARTATTTVRPRQREGRQRAEAIPAATQEPRPQALIRGCRCHDQLEGRRERTTPRPPSRWPFLPSPPLSTQRGAHPPGRARCPWRRGLAGARRGQAREPCAQGRGAGAAMTGGPAPAPIGRWRRKGRGEGGCPDAGELSRKLGCRSWGSVWRRGVGA